MGLDETIDTPDRLPDAAVIPPAPQQRRQLHKNRRLFGIALLHDLGERLLPEKANFPLLRYPELRGNIQ